MDTLDARKEIESYIKGGAPYWTKELLYDGLVKFDQNPDKGWEFCQRLEQVLELLMQYNDTFRVDPHKIRIPVKKEHGTV